MHSSYDEIFCLVRLLQPREVIPTTDILGLEGNNEMNRIMRAMISTITSVPTPHDSPPNLVALFHGNEQVAVSQMGQSCIHPPSLSMIDVESHDASDDEDTIEEAMSGYDNGNCTSHNDGNRSLKTDQLIVDVGNHQQPPVDSEVSSQDSLIDLIKQHRQKQLQAKPVDLIDILTTQASNYSNTSAMCLEAPSSQMASSGDDFYLSKLSPDIEKKNTNKIEFYVREIHQQNDFINQADEFEQECNTSLKEDHQRCEFDGSYNGWIKRPVKSELCKTQHSIIISLERDEELCDDQDNTYEFMLNAQDKPIIDLT